MNSPDKYVDKRTLNELIWDSMDDESVKSIFIEETRGIENEAEVKVNLMFPGSEKAIVLKMGVYPFGSIIVLNERPL